MSSVPPSILTHSPPLRAQVPGFSKGDIKVHLEEDGTLVVDAQKKVEKVRQQGWVGLGCWLWEPLACTCGCWLCDM